MNTTKGASEKLANRLAEIIIQLHQKSQVSRVELAEKFQVSARTIFRDLNRLSALIEHSGGDNYRLSPEFRQSLLMSDIDHLIKISGAAEIFAGQNAGFWSSLLKDDQHHEFSVKTMSPEYLDKSNFSQTFGLLRQAINSHKYCSFHYKNKSRLVQPYRLVNSKNIWYLVAVEEQKPKSFLVSGISWLKREDGTFVPEKYIEQCIEQEDDVWFSLNKFPVTLHVDASVAHYFLRRNVLPSQVITQHHNNGSLEVICEIADERQLLPWIRYWLPHLRIVSPQTLHSVLIQQLNEALNLFSSPEEINKEQNDGCK